VSLQERFDETYISSTEICQRLDVHRTTVFHGSRAGKLPPERIVIRRANGDPHILLWIRAEAEPMMVEWAKAIASRKGL
jgi:hypothetical protein